MNLDQFEFVSWEKLHQACFRLAKKISHKKLQLDRIVCISRGGLIVARIFSDFLDLPISNFTIVSYVSIGKTGKPKVVEELTADIKNERILLVDEIVDHGTTLKKAITYLKTFSPKKITVVAPYIKSWSLLQPDIWQVKTDKWVIFSYEVRETIEEVASDWIKKGFSKQKIEKNLVKLGFEKKMVKVLCLNIRRKT